MSHEGYSNPTVGPLDDGDGFRIHLGRAPLRRICQAMIAGTALLILVTLVTDLGFEFEHAYLNRIMMLFDLKLEGNIAVWFSSTLLFVTGIAALFIAAQMPTRPRHVNLAWVLAALFFIGLSVDEAAQLHEAVGRMFTREIAKVPWLTPGAGGDFGWLVALTPFILAFLAVMLIVSQSLRPYPPSYRLAAAGVGCWIGVLLAEVIQAQLRRLSMERSVQGVIEEGLEIVGTNLFLASFLKFLRFARMRRGAMAPNATPGRKATAGKSKMPGLHLWRRLRRRSAAALRATFDVLQQEPHPLRTASRLMRAAIQHRMKPQDTLLYDLDRRPAADARGFLTKRSHTLLQDLLNPPVHHHLVLNKLDYHVACLARGVAAPPVLAVVDFGPDDGRCAKLNAIRITGEADMAKFLGSLPRPTRLVFKSLLGSYGHGFLGLTVDAEGAVDPAGRRLEPAAILQHCDAYGADGGFLAQAWLEPDPALRPLMPGQALGTVRVVTLLVGDQVRFPFAFVKIPVGTNVYDAFHHGRTGNLLASVDVVDGSVGTAWGPSPTRRHRLETYPAHPDNGVAIEGFLIPRWQEVLRVVIHGARAFPELKTLGWDVAITSKEVFLLEGNHHWDPQVPQVLLRRGFRPDMESLVTQAGCRASAS